jgi:hypothetical protein
MESEVGTRNGVGFGSYGLYQQQQAYLERANLAAPQPAPTAVASLEPASNQGQPFDVAMASNAITSAPLSATGEVTMAAAMPATTSVPSTANIAAFALSTSHPVGQQMYRRTGANLRSATRACGNFPSDTLAQEAFLEGGGPERDRLGVDPDGDGYACQWDPAAFRLARQG